MYLLFILWKTAEHDQPLFCLALSCFFPLTLILSTLLNFLYSCYLRLESQTTRRSSDLLEHLFYYDRLVEGVPQTCLTWTSSKNTSCVEVNEGSCYLSQQDGTCLISTSSLLYLANNMEKLKKSSFHLCFCIIFFSILKCTYSFSSGSWLSMINHCFVWRRLVFFHLPSFFIPCWIFCIFVILDESIKKSRLTVDLHTASKQLWWKWQLMSLVVYMRPSLFSIEFARIFSSSTFDTR